MQLGHAGYSDVRRRHGTGGAVAAYSRDHVTGTELARRMVT